MMYFEMVRAIPQYGHAYRHTHGMAHAPAVGKHAACVSANMQTDAFRVPVAAQSEQIAVVQPPTHSDVPVRTFQPKKSRCACWEICRTLCKLVVTLHQNAETACSDA